MTHDAKQTPQRPLQQLLFSPKGGIEGLLVMVGSKVDPNLDETGRRGHKALTEAVGKTIEVKGTADHSPKTKEAHIRSTN